MNEVKPIIGTINDEIVFIFPSMSSACYALRNRESTTSYKRVHRKLKDAIAGEREYYGAKWQTIELCYYELLKSEEKE